MPNAVSVRETPRRMTRQEWILVAMLVASVFVNYIDRANLSIAAPVLEKQLALSPLQIGTLLSAFFWTYALLQLCGLSGWIADRFPVGLVFAWGYLSWCVATIGTGFLSTFVALYAARLLLGVGESIAYPCYSRIFAELPQHHRGRANALIDAGTKVGPAIGTFIGGFLLIHFGWRMLFIVIGVLAVLWLLPWIRLMPRPAARQAAVEEAMPPTWELLSVGSAWGSFLGQFCGNYFYYFLLTWLPIYFVRERNLSLGNMTRLTSAVYFSMAVATIIAGWTSDRLIANGISPTRVRKTIAVGGLSVASLLIGFIFARNLTSAVVLLFISCLGYGAYASQHWAMGQTLAGPTMAGRWTSVQNGIGNTAGIAAPWLAGSLAQARGSSGLAFLVTGVICLAGALIWQFMVPRIEPVQWKALSRLAADGSPLRPGVEDGQ